MSNNFFALATLAIAIWGAVTGSIALILESKKFKKDRAILVVKPRFETSYHDRFPPQVSFVVSVANTGLRSAHLHELRIRIRAPNIWRDVKWGILRRGWVPVHEYQFSRSQLGPGQSQDFRTAIPKGVVLNDIKRVVVIDQTGKKWKSRSRFEQRKIKDLLNAITLREETVKSADGKRAVYLQHVKVGKKEGILIRVSDGNSAKWRFPRLESSETTLSHYMNARSLADQFVSRVIDDLIGALDA